MKKTSKKVHLYQNYLQKSAFLSKLQGFEPNKGKNHVKKSIFIKNKVLKEEKRKTQKKTKTQ